MHSLPVFPQSDVYSILKCFKEHCSETIILSQFSFNKEKLRSYSFLSELLEAELGLETDCLDSESIFP